MSGLLNIIILLIFFILYLFFDKTMRKYFSKNKKMSKDYKKFNELKTIRIKTIEEQKEFIKLQGGLGENQYIITIIIIMILIFYMALITPRFNTFMVALVFNIFFSIIFAFVITESGAFKYKEYTFITFFTSLLFAFIAISYIKFFDIISSWLILGLFVGIFLLLKWLKVV